MTVPDAGPRAPVVVTGAGGFIGSAICQKLRALGQPVTALLRAPRDGPWDAVIVHELGTGPLPVDAFAGHLTVFHLAGLAHAVGDPTDADAPYVRVNVEGTREVLAAAAAGGVARVVFASSVKAMGEGGAARQDEDMLAAPRTAYGRSKYRAEELLFAAARAGPLEAVALRLTMVHGPGHRGNLARMFEAVAAGRFPPLAASANRRSMVHVDDVVEAALVTARVPGAAGRTYIVTEPRAYSTAQIHALMCTALGRAPPRWKIPIACLRPLAWLGDVAGALRGRRFGFDSSALARLTESAWYDGSRLTAETGFAPRRGLEDTLAALASARDAQCNGSAP